MATPAASAASGLVSIERNRVRDATGSLSSRLATPASICSAACPGAALTSGTEAASITRRNSSFLEPK
jgi:hypothetical protein